MRRRVVLAFSVLAVVCLAALAVWFGRDAVWTSTAEARRALELKAHHTLMRSIAEPGSGLAPFASDGCSGGLSAAWRSLSDRFPRFAQAHRDTPPWEPCCVTHDRAYHRADGARAAQESYDLRLAADEAFRTCVYETRRGREALLAGRYGLTPHQIETAYAVLSDAMFDAVRIGGLPCSGLPWRWGYGYPPCRDPAKAR